MSLDYGVDDLRTGSDDLMVLLTSALGEALDESVSMHNDASDEVIESICSNDDNQRTRNLIGMATALLAVWTIDRHGVDLSALRREINEWIDKWEVRHDGA